MTLNPAATGHDQFDVLQGSVTNHFTRIESVLLQNECINGQYNTVTAASYASNTPVASPGFTRVCISTNGTIISDLENSYIEANLEYAMKMNKAHKSVMVNETAIPITRFFVGFKQSLEALERYDLYVNSNQIYSQSFVGPESTVLLAGLNNTILENNPWVYTTYHNACTMDQNVCGVYIDTKDIEANSTFTVKIPIKINLHQFLLLSSIHYLPAFAGRWELVLYFGSKNLIVTPVLPTAYMENLLSFDDNRITHRELITHSINVAPVEDANFGSRMKGWANYFTQVGSKFPMPTAIAQNGKVTFTDLCFTAEKCTLTKCLMNITQFQLKYEVYQSLMAHYVESPLIIPTNHLAYNRFSHSGAESDSINATANISVENIDSIFVLIPEDANQQTCYYQPYLKGVHMNMGEFGVHPQQYMDTFGGDGDFNNRRFVSYLLDALNLESSQISAMNKDFSNSVNPHPILWQGAKTDSLSTVRSITNGIGKHYDSSHFMIGFPCSQVGFQSGTISSPNSNINFQFNANKATIPGGTATVKIEPPIICMFLVDCELMIQVVPNSDIPLVKFSAKSIV